MSSAESRQAAIRTLLSRRAGKTPDAKAIASAAAETWPEIAGRLAPVIGARGVDILFRRALHQTTTIFPWLLTAAEREGGVAALATFVAHLSHQEAAIGAEASYALLVKFTELLVTLVGESLTERLLGPVWTPPLPMLQTKAE